MSMRSVQQTGDEVGYDCESSVIAKHASWQNISDTGAGLSRKSSSYGTIELPSHRIQPDSREEEFISSWATSKSRQQTSLRSSHRCGSKCPNCGNLFKQRPDRASSELSILSPLLPPGDMPGIAKRQRLRQLHYGRLSAERCLHSAPNRRQCYGHRTQQQFSFPPMKMRKYSLGALIPPCYHTYCASYVQPTHRWSGGKKRRGSFWRSFDQYTDHQFDYNFIYPPLTLATGSTNPAKGIKLGETIAERSILKKDTRSNKNSTYSINLNSIALDGSRS